MKRFHFIENLTKESTKTFLVFLTTLILVISIFEFFRLKENLNNQFILQSKAMLRPIGSFYLGGDLVSLRSYLNTLVDLQDFSGQITDTENNYIWKKLPGNSNNNSFFTVHYNSSLEFENGSTYGTAQLSKNILKDYYSHFKKLLLTLAAVLLISISFIFIHKRSLALALRPLYEVKDDLKKQAASLMFVLSKETDHELEDIRSWFFSVSNAWKQQNKIIQEQTLKIAKSELAAQVAHDIRSPLTALQVAVEQLKLPESNSKNLALNAIVRIKKIASDLLNENKNSSLETYFTFQSIPQLVKSIIDEKNCQLPSSSRPITFKTEIFHLYAFIDEKEVGRAISNIIQNSIEATTSETRCISVMLSFDESFVHIQISDNGPGISDEAVASIGKQPFSTRKTHHESGNGLGLSHAHKTILNCNGSFEIKTQNGSGTIAIISLPRIKANANKNEEPSFLNELPFN